MAPVRCWLRRSGPLTAGRGWRQRRCTPRRSGSCRAIYLVDGKVLRRLAIHRTTICPPRRLQRPPCAVCGTPDTGRSSSGSATSGASSGADLHRGSGECGGPGVRRRCSPNAEARVAPLPSAAITGAAANPPGCAGRWAHRVGRAVYVDIGVVPTPVLYWSCTTIRS